METNYFLALEKRPGDTKFIDIQRLSISSGFDPKTLNLIDSFTMNFTIEELKKAILDDNLVENDYLKGRLVIQDNFKKHTLEVIDKNLIKDFNLYNYLKERINNKELINNIIYKLKNIINDEEIITNLKQAQEDQDIVSMVNIITSIDYFAQRKFIVYLLHIYLKEQDKNQERIRDKAA